VDTESEYGFAGPLAAGAITASGTTIFTAHGGGGFDIVLRAFDVSNPARPVIVDSVVVEEGQGEDLWPGGPEAVTFRAGRVFVTMCHGYATDCAVRVYDGTWPDRLRLVGDFSTQVYARRVAIAGCQALIADGYGGLLVTSASRSGARVPDAPGESAALPNIVDQLFLPYVNVGAVCLLDR
jgi:hypothetical protein